ncbi:MAG: glycosyltransferase family 39 protein [Bacteroidetes bacterium]|nr:MAG: glycosyltransferase family 39 protein [Bacteroidota bacterium]
MVYNLKNLNGMKSYAGKTITDPIIIFLVVFNILIHLFVISNLEYHRDELLYFSLGLHPAAGYATVPPMIGWIAWLMQNIFGYSLFAVRLFPAIMSGLMVFVVSSIAKELGGSRYSTILAAIGIILSIFGLRTFALFQPVHLDLLFWTISIYLVIKYINTSLDKYLVLFGIFAGIALLNKYLIALLFFCFLVTIPFTQLKRVFGNPRFWTGILAGLIVFLPNLIWQILHGLPVTGHLSELARTQLVNVDRIAFLTDQIIIPGGASFLTIAGLLYLFINKNAVKFRIMGIMAVLIILILMLLRGKSYYTIGLFPFLIAAGAVSAENILKKTWTRLLLIVFLIIITIPVIPIGIPVLRTEGLVNYFNVLGVKYKIDVGRRWEDGSIHSLPQDYADMLGWEELAALADKAYQMVPDKKSCFIYCENYGQAGAITVIGKKYGLPEAVCFSESFRYWIPKQFNPDIKSLIYINDEPGEDVKAMFRKIMAVGSISNPDAREHGTTVYLCEDPAGSFNEFWTSRLKNLN